VKKRDSKLAEYPAPVEYVNNAITEIYLNNCFTFDNVSTERIADNVMRHLTKDFIIFRKNKYVKYSKQDIPSRKVVFGKK
jgi:hypothetical protein